VTRHLTSFGRLPGANVAAACVAILIAVELLSPGAVFAAWIVTLIGYGVYAWKRPIGGVDCFVAFAAPIASAWCLYLIFGLPHRAATAIMLALGLLVLMVIDRDDRWALEAP
jgi:hypothetical protein